jgi:hypothetical protein
MPRRYSHEVSEPIIKAITARIHEGRPIEIILREFGAIMTHTKLKKLCKHVGYNNHNNRNLLLLFIVCDCFHREFYYEEVITYLNTNAQMIRGLNHAMWNRQDITSTRITTWVEEFEGIITTYPLPHFICRMDNMRYLYMMRRGIHIRQLWEESSDTPTIRTLRYYLATSTISPAGWNALSRPLPRPLPLEHTLQHHLPRPLPRPATPPTVAIVITPPSTPPQPRREFSLREFLSTPLPRRPLPLPPRSEILRYDIRNEYDDTRNDTRRNEYDIRRNDYDIMNTVLNIPTTTPPRPSLLHNWDGLLITKTEDAEGTTDTICSICLTEFINTSMVKTGCSHHYCLPCFNKQIARNGARCPMCRAGITEICIHRELYAEYLEEKINSIMGVMG